MGIIESYSETYGKANVHAVILAVIVIGVLVVSGGLIGVGESSIMAGETTVTVSNGTISDADSTLVRANYEQLPEKDQRVIDAAIENGSGNATYTNVVSYLANPSVQDGSAVQQAAQSAWSDSWDGDVNDMRTEDSSTYIIVENRPDTPPTPLRVSATYGAADSYTLYKYIVILGIIGLSIGLIGIVFVGVIVFRGLKYYKYDNGDQEPGDDSADDGTQSEIE